MKINTLFLLTFLASTYAFGNWENPSERYASEYKNHLDATCPIPKSNIKHFVYFARDRDSIKNHALLKNKKFSGAQIMYSWAELEPQQDTYNFSNIEADLSYLEKFGKKLFIQLQDATFSPEYKGVPSYLLTPEYETGVSAQYSDDGVIEGWVAKRWNTKVHTRFAKLLIALGNHFDGRIEGINLQETAIGVSAETDPSFSNKKYLQAIKMNMNALKGAFPRSVTLQYANFMPGEWLPWENKGFLKSVYQYSETIGVGMGAPDLMMQKKGQLNHALTMMHEHNYSVPLAIAVQDGNYIGQTGTLKVKNKRENLVPALYSFAAKFLKVNYMFWANQEPYFEQDVLPCFADKPI